MHLGFLKKLREIKRYTPMRINKIKCKSFVSKHYYTGHINVVLVSGLDILMPKLSCNNLCDSQYQGICGLC